LNHSESLAYATRGLGIAVFGVRIRELGRINLDTGLSRTDLVSRRLRFREDTIELTSAVGTFFLSHMPL